MTRLELEAFLAVVKYGSISQAADRLFTTQPGLSRRIRMLEEELGYEVFVRGRGIRNIKLTRQGEDFLLVAERFLKLYREVEEIPGKTRKPLLRVSTVNSLATYLLPPVLKRLMEGEEGCDVVFHSGRSMEIYGYVENKEVDVALVSDVLHSTRVITFPAFREPFVFAGGEKWKGVERVKPEMLNPKDQIRMPWNPEYDVWHNKWFPPDRVPSLTGDKMVFLENFLEGEKWAVMPLLVAKRIKKQDICICPLENGPEDLTIYCLTGDSERNETIKRFLALVHEELLTVDGIQSFLGTEGVEGAENG